MRLRAATGHPKKHEMVARDAPAGSNWPPQDTKADKIAEKCGGWPGMRLRAATGHPKARMQIKIAQKCGGGQ